MLTHQSHFVGKCLLDTKHRPKREYYEKHAIVGSEWPHQTGLLECRADIRPFGFASFCISGG